MHLLQSYWNHSDFLIQRELAVIRWWIKLYPVAYRYFQKSKTGLRLRIHFLLDSPNLLGRCDGSPVEAGTVSQVVISIPPTSISWKFLFRKSALAPWMDFTFTKISWTVSSGNSLYFLFRNFLSLSSKTTSFWDARSTSPPDK